MILYTGQTHFSNDHHRIIDHRSSKQRHHCRLSCHHSSFIMPSDAIIHIHHACSVLVLTMPSRHDATSHGHGPRITNIPHAYCSCVMHSCAQCCMQYAVFPSTVSSIQNSRAPQWRGIQARYIARHRLSRQEQGPSERLLPVALLNTHSTSNRQ